MPIDITKCRSGQNWHEGCAVTAVPVTSSPTTSILHVAGNTDKNWSEYALIISKKWKNIGYYYTGDYINAQTTADYDTDTNADAVITYAADAYGRHSIDGISWSYSGGTPANSTLKIEDGSGNIIFSEDITVAGPGFFKFENELAGTIGRAMIITLTAGGSGVVGKLNVLGHKIV